MKKDNKSKKYLIGSIGAFISDLIGLAISICYYIIYQKTLGVIFIALFSFIIGAQLIILIREIEEGKRKL